MMRWLRRALGPHAAVLEVLEVLVCLALVVAGVAWKWTTADALIVAGIALLVLALAPKLGRR